ncbi:MAG: F0F1 ATP synthase subunit gamma [Prosthecochloris sp.]|uniref:ATP synthase gamma chain n=1 Tax=Prosthecochloris aestuarii (strain DSM 271 / SK 413) TaxID=290512 RepID=ATPG_PROA2|nr:MULTISPECIES: F0F1 ATP synthase subunit gamma [Prosthecochloris]B4S3X4.1 RecName: Full=ATP synthase gamma chain; AltName: Full=ATP synthase F1 sector gamma subunit; AltName: Full=F-ATPase gamma subunit [Prosthecochloris aestuarii DSM 271]ACF45320.1 ATP synthase F1, gamma subunit [Prosthecochloris aestuarii DSM 271]MCW8798389.1 F0F1 ATP synthase subunit gamma [Prosthecochloris sp.]NEX12913.1 ATP synthase subunit gamma [Prosthecochloris sp.]RDD31034.1 ATP synthase subunit gamma [Prosthecochlo
MATLKDIRTRIKGVKSTQQVTKAMKMVAAAKLRRAQESAVQARPYAAKLKEMLGSLSTKVDTSLNPMLSARDEVGRVLVVLITSDRGLCGAFNTNIIKVAQKVMTVDHADLHKSGKVDLICAGSKGYDFFRKRDYRILKGYPGVFQNLDFSVAKEIAEQASGMYLRGEVDKVVVVYNEFKSVLAPNLKSEVLLPITPEGSGDEGGSDYIYEPSPASIIDVLVPKHLNTQVWRMMLESNAAEQAARMAAMDSATENAKELLRLLNISYNRARQAAITTELSEIVAGAEALQGT